MLGPPAKRDRSVRGPGDSGSGRSSTCRWASLLRPRGRNGSGNRNGAGVRKVRRGFEPPQEDHGGCHLSSIAATPNRSVLAGPEPGLAQRDGVSRSRPRRGPDGRTLPPSNRREDAGGVVGGPGKEGPHRIPGTPHRSTGPSKRRTHECTVVREQTPPWRPDPYPDHAFDRHEAARERVVDQVTLDTISIRFPSGSRSSALRLLFPVSWGG